MKKTWSAFLVLVLSSVACNYLIKPKVVVLPTNTSLAPATAPAVTLPTATVEDSYATVQPVDTAQPTETPQLAGEFTEGFDGDISSWTMLPTQGQKEKINVSTENSALVFDITGANIGAFMIYEPTTYQNVRVSASVKNLSRNDGKVGLLCRYDGSRWYEFDVTTSGLYQILYGYWNADKASAKYQVIADGASDLIHTDQSTNEISASCEGALLILSINGNEARRVSETQWNLSAEGNVGVTADSLQRSPLTVGFDSVTVSPRP